MTTDTRKATSTKTPTDEEIRRYFTRSEVTKLTRKAMGDFTHFVGRIDPVYICGKDTVAMFEFVELPATEKLFGPLTANDEKSAREIVLTKFINDFGGSENLTQHLIIKKTVESDRRSWNFTRRYDPDHTYYMPRFLVTCYNWRVGRQYDYNNSPLPEDEYMKETREGDAAEGLFLPDYPCNSRAYRFDILEE